MGLDTLRAKTTYVPKDVFITDGTLMDNLKIVNPLLTDEEVIRKCVNAGYDKFVQTLPGQYAFMLTQGGTQLSSGQKQKLETVRAFLADSEIVLLDEATSDLDGIAETEILTMIKRWQKHASSYWPAIK
jgi:ABC-type bacteriocin/lantibiotic exporter with double-glycine peptidase domain